MSWKNAFDDGACTVTVTLIPDNGDPSTVYTGSLGKGDSDTFTVDNLGGYDTTSMSIAIDADGRVTLSVTGDYYFGGNRWAVDVAPASMDGVTGGRLTDPQCDSTNDVPDAYARSDGTDELGLSSGGGG